MEFLGQVLGSFGQVDHLVVFCVFLFLQLHVAVLKDWSRDPRALGELGYPEE